MAPQNIECTDVDMEKKDGRSERERRRGMGREGKGE